MNEKDCVFCKIVANEIPAEKIHEDQFSISFLDISPVNEGHLLVIPKEHFSSFAETPNEMVGKLFIKAKEIMPALQSATNADFIALTIIGTDVPHFHIHLIPRFKNDGLSGFWPTKKYENAEKMKEVSEKIKSSLKDK